MYSHKNKTKYLHYKRHCREFRLAVQFSLPLDGSSGPVRFLTAATKQIQNKYSLTLVETSRAKAEAHKVASDSQGFTALVSYQWNHLPT